MADERDRRRLAWQGVDINALYEDPTPPRWTYVYTVELREDFLDTVTETNTGTADDGKTTATATVTAETRWQESTVCHVASTEDGAFRWATKIGLPSMRKSPGYQTLTRESWRFVICEEKVDDPDWLGTRVCGSVTSDGTVDREGNVL